MYLPLELTKLGTLAGHTDAVQALLLHQGRLVSGSADCTIRMWDYQNRKLLATCAMPVSAGHAEHTAVHALGHCAVNGRKPETLWSGHWGGSINLWNAPESVRLRALEGVHDGPVWALQPLPYAAELMASGGADGAIRLWDARSSARAGEMHAGAPVYALAATSDTGADAMLVSAGYDGSLKVWDIRAMRAAPLANLQAHRAPVRSLLVRDGAVWSGSTDGTVRCWDLSHIAPINSPSYEQQQLLEHFIATGTNPGGVQPSFISP
jgi:WD40 repeat protein